MADGRGGGGGMPSERGEGEWTGNAGEWKRKGRGGGEARGLRRARSGPSSQRHCPDWPVTAPRSL